MKKLFTRQSLLCIFFIVLICGMASLTAYNMFYARRAKVIKIYEEMSTLDNSKAVTLAKTGVGVLSKIDDFIPVQSVYITVYGLVQRVIGNRYVYDPVQEYADVVKLDNGQLNFAGVEDIDIGNKVAGNLSRLKEILDTKKISFLHVTTPYKTDPTNSLLPTGVNDWQNQKISAVSKALSEAGIDNICLTDYIKEQGLDFQALFFNTDHHWIPSTALWAAQTVSEYLNDNYKYNIDLSLFDKNNFSSTVYKNIFLGSQGKKVGPLYSGVDDFELLLPKYNTNLTSWFYRINEEEITLNGDFEQTLIFKENLAKNYFFYNVYATYSGGDYAKTSIINHNNPNGKRVLLVRDSFSCTFAPFFALGCKELYTIDLRNTDASLTEYVNEVNPDIVIYLEYPYFEEAKATFQ